MKPRYVAALFGVLFVLSVLTPAAQAAPEDEEIPKLRIFFEKEMYAVGEQVNITAEVYANGRLVNPDAPGVTLALLMNFTFGEGGPGDVEWIQMDKVPGETGKFTGGFLSQPWHVVVMEPQQEGLPLAGKVFFTMAICSYFEVQATAMGVVMVEEGPVVNVVVSDHDPSPGDTVTITVTTSNSRVPIEAADVLVNLSSYDGINEVDLGALTDVRESVGVYKAQYTIPVDLRTATLYTVRAGASFTEYNASAYLFPLFGTGFMVNFFDVWFQNVTSDGDETTLATWVADMDGNAVEGASIDLDVDVIGGSGTTTEQVSGTTDADGKYEVTIDHTGADRLDIMGAITDGVRTQRVYMEGIIDNTPPEPPTPDPEDEGFSVKAWEENDQGPIFDMIKEPGDPIHVKYRAFNESGAFPNKRINWYLIDMDGFFDTNYTTIESGFEVSDSNGDFDLTFTVPDSNVNGWIMFEATNWDDEKEPMPGLVRQESTEPLIDAGFFSRDENIEISVDRVHKDDPVELRANVPLPESYYIGQFFAVYDEDSGLTQWGQPQALGPMSDDFNIMPLQKMGPDLFGMDKQLPEFFPEDQSVAFMVISVDVELFRIQMNYVMLGYGESTTKGIDVGQSEEPDPVHAGENGTLEFQVENTGAGTDHYTVEQMTGSDWLEWESETITVEPSDTGTFTATVVVPPGVNENRYYFNVTVTSETDDTFSASIELFVDVMVNGVDVGIVDDEATASREESVDFVVSIENTGQGNDTFAITLTGEGAPWATPSHTSVTLQEGGTAEVIVQVSVPDDADEDTYTMGLTATSEDGVTDDSVMMAVHVLVDGVDVKAATDLAETWRENTVTLEFNITNTGQGNDTFTLVVEGEMASWAVLSDEELLVEEGETELVIMEVTPPDDADAGFYEFTLLATSANGITNDSDMSRVHVWVTGVELTAEVVSRTGYREDQLRFDFDIENTGQERDVFALTHAGGDWAQSLIFSSNPVALDPGESGSVSITVILSATIDEGKYTFDVTATSSDQVINASLELEVDVTVNGVEVSLSQTSIAITKGEEKEVSLTITNTGQGSDTFNVLLLGAASNWTEASAKTVTVAEGASETITLTLSPGKKVEGKQAFLDITVVSSDPEFNDAAQLEVLLKEPPEEGGISTTTLIAIVIVIIIIVALLVYMMQARTD